MEKKVYVIFEMYGCTDDQEVRMVVDTKALANEKINELVKIELAKHPGACCEVKDFWSWQCDDHPCGKDIANLDVIFYYEETTMYCDKNRD